MQIAMLRPRLVLMIKGGFCDFILCVPFYGTVLQLLTALILLIAIISLIC